MSSLLATLDTQRVGFPHWTAHPTVWAVMILLEGSYLLGVQRHGQRYGPGSTERRRVVAFSAGVLVLWIASDYPIHDLAEHYLYSVHMVQHLLMTLVAAPLFLLGTPEWLARLILKPRWLFATVKGASRPITNLIQANAILVLSHWPVVVQGTLHHHALHPFAHGILLGSALIMWMPIISPHPEIPRLGPLVQMVYLFLETIIPTIPASFLTFGTSLLYPIYGTFPRLWGISAVTDQQVSGLIMKVGATMYLWGIIGTIFFRWYADEERHPKDVLLWEDVARELNVDPDGSGSNGSGANGAKHGVDNGHKPAANGRGVQPHRLRPHDS